MDDETHADDPPPDGDAIPENPDVDDAIPDDPDVDDAIEELEELAAIVDRPVEREKVQRTMQVLERAKRPRIFELRHRFGIRDAGESVLGAVVFGVPMIVEDGTLAVGRYVASNPLYLALTVGFGVALVVGILSAVDFTEIEEDLILGVVPRRLLGILAVAGLTAGFLMTLWGRVTWDDAWLALCQVTVTAVVMAVGASLGDIIPES